RIVGMPVTQAKNWTTLGRFMMVRPSIRTALGPGSRNLFSRTDVYRMALAYVLRKGGFSTAQISQLLTGIPYLWWEKERLVIWRSGMQAKDYTVTTTQVEPTESVVLWHSVKVQLLKGRIDVAIAQFQETREQRAHGHQIKSPPEPALE